MDKLSISKMTIAEIYKYIEENQFLLKQSDLRYLCDQGIKKAVKNLAWAIDNSIKFSVERVSESEGYYDLKFHIFNQLKDFLPGNDIFSSGKQTNSKRQKENVSYLFVGGPPRSGTSALGRLLNESEEICLFVEAYNHKFGYAPQMFEPDFVSSIKGVHSEKNLNLLGSKKFEKLKYIGDKRPSFNLSQHQTFHQFKPEELKLIYIVRCPYSIAASYEKRASRASLNNSNDWNMHKGALAACEEMNINMERVLEMKNSVWQESLVVVDFDDVFTSEEIYIKLLNFLTVTYTEIMKKSFERNIDDISSSKISYPKNIVEVVDNNLNWDLFNKLKGLTIK